MKNKKRIFVLTALLLVASFLLVSCSKGNKFTANNGKYVDNKTNITYIDAPSAYSPIKRTENVYGTMGNVTLYEMEGIDPTKWLCEIGGTVFYAETEELPELEEMDQVEIVFEDVALMTFTNAEDVALVAQAYLTGESITKPYIAEDGYRVNWRIRFADMTRGIYYTVDYYVITEDHVVENADGTQTNYGDRFFYNRFEKRFVPAGDIFDTYVDEYLELTE